MPTNETPSAGAVEKVKTTRLIRDIMELGMSYTRADAEVREPFLKAEERALEVQLALALDAFAREREAAVWEEAAQVIDDDHGASPPSELARRFRARAAEARRTG